MRRHNRKLTYTTLLLVLTLCFCSTSVIAQQATGQDSMSMPQEMMMRQMAIRAHQYQGQGKNNSDNSEKDLPKDSYNPRSIMNMMGPQMGPMSRGSIAGSNRHQLRSMMMGSNMGQGMMQGNMMAYPMMGFATGQDRENMVAYEKYIKDTRELRRTLTNKRFDFRESFWVPETTLQELRDMAQEINTLQQELTAKMPVQETEKE